MNQTKVPFGEVAAPGLRLTIWRASKPFRSPSALASENNGVPFYIYADYPAGRGDQIIRHPWPTRPWLCPLPHDGDLVIAERIGTLFTAVQTSRLN